MKKQCFYLLSFSLISVIANAQVNQPVEFRAAKFQGNYRIKESCELGESDTKVKVQIYHHQVSDEANASYLNVEAYGSKLKGIDIPISSGWAYNHGEFYSNYPHYELNEAQWVKIGAMERLVVEQNLHLLATKKLVKNYYKIEAPAKNQIRIEASYTNSYGNHGVNCDLTKE